ncbi:hypothetical protein M1N79_02845 [Dehalococcoidia bacterium]|nr:hypothetical protein [Dehalococcoidia bacterium]
MEVLIEQLAKIQVLNQIGLALLLLIPLVLIARTVVAGTYYSPILIIVIFGLSMGYILYVTGVAEPGLAGFPVIGLISGTVVIVLTGVFFAGGQELRKLFGGAKMEPDQTFKPSEEEGIVGTKRTQMASIIRAFFLLLGIAATIRVILGDNGGYLSQYYPIIAYIGLLGGLIIIDLKDTIANKSSYIRKGAVEIAGILGLLVFTYYVAMWIENVLPLPQIFFIMIFSLTLGWLFHKWRFGPTIRALLFAGIPLALAGVFVVGGSRIADAFAIVGMGPVIAYGFFGQVLWMFGGIALLMYFGKTCQVRSLGPGMAGSLSHAGLTGACTAGDLGPIAAARAPIMINIPFFGHLILFPILAMSIERGELMLLPAIAAALAGLIITAFSLRTLKNANGDDRQEVKGLMQFSLGWQFTAIFAGLVLLHLSGMPLDHAAMAKSSGVSHFGLFAATHGGMFGAEAAGLITFIFAMPFLVHPLVFFMFGQGMEKKGAMPRWPVYLLGVMGVIGVIYALLIM